MNRFGLVINVGLMLGSGNFLVKGWVWGLVGDPELSSN